VGGTGRGSEPDETWGGGAGRNEFTGTALGPVVQARNIEKVQFMAPKSVPAHVPRQLLPPPAHFTDRDLELTRLREYLDDRKTAGGTTLVVITGVGGIGKTSLALSLLHEVRERYPAGQLFADLGAFSLDEPVPPAEVLGRFLRSLGVQPEGVPIDFHERATLYRSLTDGRPVAVMLDNVASAAHARALLPGPGPNLVVVTSRRHISSLSLDGAWFVELPPLGNRAAAQLVERILGSARAGSESHAVRGLVGLCDGLPLAVCASAARLARRPQWSVDRMVRELASERRRLTALSAVDDVSVRAVFDVSYQTLEPGTAMFYRRIGLLPVADFGPEVAAAIADVDTDEAYDLLDRLVDANLLQEIGDRRFRFHDLVRLHARERSSEEGAEERRAALDRSVDWHLRAVVAADLLVMPERWRLGAYYEEPPPPPVSMDTSAAAIEWLEGELPNILTVLRFAADNELDEAGWQLCEALWGLFTFRKHYDAWIESHLIGLACAKRCSDPRAEARMHVQLGSAYRSLRRFDDALDNFNHALRLERSVGHRLGEGSALDQIGVVMLRLSRHSEAIKYFTDSRAIHEEVNVPRGVALMNFNIGQALGEAGRHVEAITHLETACRQFAAIPEPYHEARALTTLARIRIRAGRSADAVQPLRHASAALANLGASYDHAHVQLELANLYEARGDTSKTRMHLEHSLELFTAVGAPQGRQVRARLEALGFAPESPPAEQQEGETPLS
jgi:tetratricopeptide (TPR) repeat protein